MRATVLYVVALAAACCVATAARAPKSFAQQSAKPASRALSSQEIFRRVSPSVVVVESLDAKGSVIALGSGVVLARSAALVNRIITNRHVIEDGVAYAVEHDGKIWLAKLIRVDPDHDLAELSVGGFAAPPVQVRNSLTLAIGEKVYAIGAPEGLELTISGGLISGLRDFDGERVIQTSAAISPGSSGGGLFDAEGRLVGITTFYLKEGQSLNFALPPEWALNLDRRPGGALPVVVERVGSPGRPAPPERVWTSLTSGHDYRVRFDGDYIYTDWVNIPLRFQGTGLFMRSQLRKTGDKWAGETNAYLPFMLADFGFSSVRWCRIQSSIEITKVTDSRIEGRAQAFARFNVRKCKPKKIEWKPFTWVLKE